MKIRLATPDDAQQLACIYYETIRRVNIRDYTKEQVEAWAHNPPDEERWKKRMPGRITFLAEDNGTILGFGELEPTGHIDCFYCHHACQRQGIGSQIYRKIENEALDLGLTRLFTEASVTARPFFEAHGFYVRREQTVVIRGVGLNNFVMEKKLLGARG